MELSSPQEMAKSILMFACTIIVLYATYSWFADDQEAAVEYEVQLPVPCLQESSKNLDVLKSPSIEIPGSTVIQCYNPANGKLLGRINPTTAEGIDRAIAKAKEAQTQWAKTTFTQRRKLLKTLLKYILDHQEEIVRIACLDSGKTRVDASFGEVLVTAEKLAWTIKHGEKALTPQKRPTNLLMCYKHNEVRWEPLGVVTALVSWNYPFHNLLNPIISSLFAGNAIIVKSSEQTAWSAQYFTSIVRGALTACSQSPALVQSTICWPSVAPHLTSHPSISHITFIGSRPVAHSVATSAAKSLIPVCVELGGKDAAIVLDDVQNLSKVASILMRGVFQSAGQNCIGIERVIALPCSYERLRSNILPRIRALRVGSALDDEEDVDVGACISPVSFDKLEALICDAVDRGADLLCGGTRYNHPKWPRGHYFLPTLLVGVTSDMPIAQQELFAPIFVLMRAESVENAIAITNSTTYGLGCSVFGSKASDLEKVTSDVKVGMVSVNDFASYYMCGLPFGGVRGSGYGRFGGAEGLRSLCNTKSVCRDRWPGLMSTSIPRRLDYVSKKEQAMQNNTKGKAWEFVQGIVEVGYGMGFRQRLYGVSKILANA